MHQNGFNKVLIRIYQEATGDNCWSSASGSIDPGFLPSYQAAISAGFKAPDEIDAYMFPCAGPQPNGGACKSIDAQVGELTSYLLNKDIKVHRLWLDIEPENDDYCNSWHQDSSSNLALANQWIAAIRSTGLKWGIYANGYVFLF